MYDPVAQHHYRSGASNAKISQLCYGLEIYCETT